MASEQEHPHEHLGMFEAATRSEGLKLQLPEVKSVVVITDGSNQSTTASTLGKLISEKLKATLHKQSNPKGATADLLKLCEKHEGDLLIVPAPFGRDIEVLKDESLGSVVDMLLQESKCPVLCARQPMTEDECRGALEDILLPVLDLEHGHKKAAEWAFRLSPKKLELLGVADEEVIGEARAMFEGAIDPEALKAEALNRAVQRDIGSLVAAIQKLASENEIDLHVEIKTGRPIELTQTSANSRPRLSVVFTTHDHTNAAHHHAVDVVLGATGPVLVV